MIDLIVLIFACTFLAHLVESYAADGPSVRAGISHNYGLRFLYFVIITAFALYAGLRSRYNDTLTYMTSYRMLDASKLDLAGIFDSYGGFFLYERLLKRYIGTSPQAFIFITAWLTMLLYLPFIARHTENFTASVFLFGICLFNSCMAGMKQMIAVGISFYAINSYLDKKYLRAIFLLWLASTFHPYIWCLLCVPLLTKKVWDGKTLLVILFCIVAFMNLDAMLSLLGILGKDYSESNFDSHTINPMRVVVELIPVVLSLVYREKINEENSRYMTLGINMRIISTVFLAMGLFMNPIYFGRMSSYFSAMSVIAIPQMLNTIWGKRSDGALLQLAYYSLFFVYFLMDMTKLGSISITHDQFRHVSIFDVF